MLIKARIIFPSIDGVGGFASERTITSPKELLAELFNLCQYNLAFLTMNPRLPDIYDTKIFYKSEPIGEENWLTYPVLLSMGAGDCLPLSTLVMRDDFEFVPMASLVPGTRIMGQGGWTTVTDAVVTGEKTILAIELGNGGVLRASPEHRLFRADGTEVRAEDVKVGELLLTSSEFIQPSGTYAPFIEGPGKGIAPNDLAWLLGIYVADGWHEQYRFAISGRDGKPKEEQKRKVKGILDAVGIGTRWHERYLAVNDPGLTRLFAPCGGHAPEKRLPTLAMSKEQVIATLSGLQADSYTTSKGTTIYGTTSPTLALQIRVLHRMLGQSVHIKRWDDHGGLGTHPIYRIGVRTKDDVRQRSAKVISVREMSDELCGDITTDQGRFWLPESDLIVHNCEDLACARVSKLWQLGESKARPYLYHKKQLWHVMVQRGNGSIEDPSARLGMYER